MEKFDVVTKLSVVVPIYEEEKNIIPFLDRLQKVLDGLIINYEIIFCLDPSSDKSEIIIKEQMKYNSAIKLILFSRKFGQPAATIAGILNCKGEACVVIDVDLQDPPELIKDLYHKLNEGYEVVYATRRSRKGESLLKKTIAYLGYILIAKLSEVHIPRNTGDFRIISRRVIEQLRQLHEKHGFLRGLVAFVGFSQTYIEFDRNPRLFGKSNYNRYLGAFKLAINGLISFSTRPLQIMSIIGFFIAFFGFCLGGFFLLQKIIGVNLTPGLSTTILAITFFSGIQLLFLGLMGEYIGRIYDEVKCRPMYIIDTIFEKNKANVSYIVEKVES
ncbi:glycosyltransferase family 2 protein [Rickettsiella endosymbiont of Miltochrista miniata]|uniref:glycosyltransferase family 2 protein n=1 Tax=Rickettsiella endosymbiont of Miltochrista miniata TaxID=3066239 RepID=UPI00313C6B97